MFKIKTIMVAFGMFFLLQHFPVFAGIDATEKPSIKNCRNVNTGWYEVMDSSVDHSINIYLEFFCSKEGIVKNVILEDAARTRMKLGCLKDSCYASSWSPKPCIKNGKPYYGASCLGTPDLIIHGKKNIEWLNKYTGRFGTASGKGYYDYMFAGKEYAPTNYYFFEGNLVQNGDCEAEVQKDADRQCRGKNAVPYKLMTNQSRGHGYCYLEYLYYCATDDELYDEDLEE